MADPANDKVAALDVITGEGLLYLDTKPKLCDVGAGHRGSYNSAIYICADNITKPIEMPCRKAASMARRIVDDCVISGKVKGAVWDDQHRFSIEIRHDWC